MTDIEEIVQDLQKKGIMLTPEALKTISQSENPKELADIAENNSEGKFIIDVSDLELKEKTKIVQEKKVIVEYSDFKPFAKEIESEVRIIDNYDVKNSTALGEMEDFIDYFKNRYEEMSKFLSGRGTNSLVSLNELQKMRGTDVKVVVMVTEKKITKNGHVLLRVEDPNGSLNALVPESNRKLVATANRLISDQIVMLEGKMSKELFIVKEIVEPDIPIRETKTTADEISMAMLSDLHVGSRLFMEKNFNNFIEWLNGRYGNEKQKELAGRIKYITIAGDIADGVGVYPTQEKELLITDIYEQYAELTKILEKIPEYIHVVLSPGDHDAVKKADPQPPLPKELMPEAYKMNNLSFISSPGTVELHGLNVLVYHGTSFVDYVAAFSEFNFQNCAKAMVEMLKKRHVHPYYGGKPITPEKKDQLIIKHIPDIFHTGESHNNSYEIYKGTLCVNSGTWQDITEYIMKQGQKATPCILPIVDMHRGKISAIHFDKLEVV